MDSLTRAGKGHPPEEQMDYSMLQQHFLLSLSVADIQEDTTEMESAAAKKCRLKQRN